MISSSRTQGKAQHVIGVKVRAGPSLEEGEGFAPYIQNMPAFVPDHSRAYWTSAPVLQ
jgi:hypothetical protein